MSTEAGHVVTAGRAPPAVDSSPSSTLSSDGNAAGKSQETPFPLNSRRLTVHYLKAVAKAVGVILKDMYYLHSSGSHPTGATHPASRCYPRCLPGLHPPISTDACANELYERLALYR